jgi:hypothetical protein
MWDILGYVLAVWISPTGALISLPILSVFGYWLYKWIHHEPKAPGAEQHVGGDPVEAPRDSGHG